MAGVELFVGLAKWVLAVRPDGLLSYGSTDGSLLAGSAETAGLLPLLNKASGFWVVATSRISRRVRG
jgi:hypothetical protein